MEGNEEGGAEEKRSAHVQRSLNRGKWLPDAGMHRRFRTMEEWLSSLVLSLLKKKTYEISLVKKRLILNRSTKIPRRCLRTIEDGSKMPPRCHQDASGRPKMGPRWRREGSLRQSPPGKPRANVSILLRFWKGEGHPVR